MATGAAGPLASHQLHPFKHVAGHPHGLLGNAYFLAFCTNQLGFEEKFPGIRLSIGEVVPPPWGVRWCHRLPLGLALAGAELLLVLHPGSATCLCCRRAGPQPACVVLSRDLPAARPVRC